MNLIEIFYHLSHIIKKRPCSYSSPQSSFSKATYMVNLAFPMFCYTKNTNDIHFKFVCKRLHAMKVSRWFILVATVITFYNNISWVFAKVNLFSESLKYTTGESVGHVFCLLINMDDTTFLPWISKCLNALLSAYVTNANLWLILDWHR